MALKLPLQNFNANLQDVQKQFVAEYKDQIVQKIQVFMDTEDRFVRCKTVTAEDETEIIARILSSGFKVGVEIKAKDKPYPSDSFHVPDIFDVVAEQVGEQGIDEDELQIKAKPLPVAGFKIMTCLLFLNTHLDQFIQIVEHQLPSSKQVKSSDFAIKTLEIIRQFNSHLKSQIIGCGAFYSKRVDKITAKHLALSQNSSCFILHVILPSLNKNLLQGQDRAQGANSRKLMVTQFEEVQKELQAHVDEITQKFISIIIDQVSGKIEKAAKSVDWDKAISKGEMIEASKHIGAISDTLSQIFKVLCSNSSMAIADIEEEIMQAALEKIFELLEKLYIE